MLSAPLCRLVCEASSELRSCGWTDEVQSYMRDRKRLCVRQDASNTLGASLLRFFLFSVKLFCCYFYMGRT